MSAAITSLANELNQADKKMTPSERALGHALLDLAGQNHAAIERLSALVGDNAELARELWPIADLLFAAGRTALGAHAVVVAKLNQSVVH